MTAVVYLNVGGKCGKLAAVDLKQKAARANILKVNRQKRLVSHTNRNGLAIKSIRQFISRMYNFISIGHNCFVTSDVLRSHGRFGGDPISV